MLFSTCTQIKNILKSLEKTVRTTESRCKDTTTRLFYDSGEHWKSDICVECICFDGEITCMRSLCSIPYCENPVKKDGECCPTCPESESQGK